MALETSLLSYAFLSVICANTVQSSFRINVTCKPPRGDICIEIRSCPYFADLLNKTPIPRPRAVIRFIKERQCGFFGNAPKVCCSFTTRSEPKKPVVDQQPGPQKDHENLRLLPKSCGIISNQFRITGGSGATLLEFPWMALIAYDTDEGIDFRCGGTLISSRYVLTAAHCLEKLSFVGVRLGEHDINKDKDCDPLSGYCAPPVQDFYVENIRIHPGYNAKNYEHDIALVRLATPANFTNENVRPVCLPASGHHDDPGKMGVISGWGVTDDGFKSSVLQKASVKIMSSTECRALYSRYGHVTDQQICAGGNKGRDSCAGDSGGPLKYVSETEGSPRYVQYGIVSYGPRHCGLAGQPGVYTRTAPYMQWILDNLKPDVD